MLELRQCLATPKEQTPPATNRRKYSTHVTPTSIPTKAELWSRGNSGELRLEVRQCLDAPIKTPPTINRRKQSMRVTPTSVQQINKSKKTLNVRNSNVGPTEAKFWPFTDEANPNKRENSGHHMISDLRLKCPDNPRKETPRRKCSAQTKRGNDLPIAGTTVSFQRQHSVFGHPKEGADYQYDKKNVNSRVALYSAGMCHENLPALYRAPALYKYRPL